MDDIPHPVVPSNVSWWPQVGPRVLGMDSVDPKANSIPVLDGWMTSSTLLSSPMSTGGPNMVQESLARVALTPKPTAPQCQMDNVPNPVVLSNIYRWSQVGLMHFGTDSVDPKANSFPGLDG